MLDLSNGNILLVTVLFLFFIPELNNEYFQENQTSVCSSDIFLYSFCCFL